MSARFAVVATLLIAGVVGCAKKAPGTAASQAAQSVDVSLQVTSISPASVVPDTARSAKVFGSAFENGATVTFTGAVTDVATDVEVNGGNTIDLVLPALPEGRYDVTVENPSGEASTLRGGLVVQTSDDGSCRSLTLNFNFDQHNLRSDARQALDKQMACLQQMSGDVRVEGHCDERGTVDYNIVLGQRRAEAVKAYLVRNGVAASRVTTVSYGEERPVNRASTELAFSQNRRAEISVTQ